MRTILKVFIELVTILLLFYVLFWGGVGLKACEILALRPNQQLNLQPLH